MRFHLLARALSGTIVAGACALAQAGTVDVGVDGQWQAFDVDEFMSQSGGLEWIELDGSALSFSFTSAVPVLLRVVDGGFSGDVFSVSLDGALLGQTSGTDVHSYPDSLGLDFDAAYASAAYSRGQWLVSAGTHVITGTLAASALVDGQPLNASVGAIQLSAVPEPAEWALMLAGLALVAVVKRHAKES